MVYIYLYVLYSYHISIHISMMYTYIYRHIYTYIYYSVHHIHIPTYQVHISTYYCKLSPYPFICGSILHCACGHTHTAQCLALSNRSLPTRRETGYVVPQSVFTSQGKGWYVYALKSQHPKLWTLVSGTPSPHSMSSARFLG